MTITHFLGKGTILFLGGQFVLLPLFLILVQAVPRRATIRFRWAVQRLLVVLSFVLPILLWLPLSQFLPSTGVAFDWPAMGNSGMESRTGTVATDRETGGMGSGSVGSVTWHGLIEPAFSLLAALGALLFLLRLSLHASWEARLRSEAMSIRRHGRISILVGPWSGTPFSTGIARPRVYLPDAVRQKRDARRMILAHEAAHIRGGHALWTLVEGFLASLFWFDPLAHLLARQGERIREALCDRDVTGRFDARSYGHMLLAVAGGHRKIVRSFGMAASRGKLRALKERIALLMHGDRGVTKRSLLSQAGAAAILSAGFLFGIVLTQAPLAAQEAGIDAAMSSEDFAARYKTVFLFPLNRKSLSDIWISSVVIRTTGSSNIGIRGGLNVGADAPEMVAVATTDGRIEKIYKETDGGISLILLIGQEIRVKYGNLDSVSVMEGATVSRGDAIGILGPEVRAAALGAVTLDSTKYPVLAQETSPGGGIDRTLGRGGNIGRKHLHFEIWRGNEEVTFFPMGRP